MHGVQFKMSGIVCLPRRCDRAVLRVMSYRPDQLARSLCSKPGGMSVDYQWKVDSLKSIRKGSEGKEIN